VPFSRAANDHQQFNANLLCDREAALMISETTADAGLQLRHRIQELLQHAPLQQKLTHNIRQFSRPDAASQIAARIVQIAEE
jgi:UDP-N-acetylglucosamine:LPS N-acetylglucosamine transferase